MAAYSKAGNTVSHIEQLFLLKSIVKKVSEPTFKWDTVNDVLTKIIAFF